MSTWPLSALRAPGVLLTGIWLPAAVIVVLVVTGCALQRASGASRSAFEPPLSSGEIVGLLAYTATRPRQGAP